MAEDNNPIEPTEPTASGAGGTEPHGDGAPAADTTDWKAEARKWEKRAKASEKQAEGKFWSSGVLTGNQTYKTDGATVQ